MNVPPLVSQTYTKHVCVLKCNISRLQTRHAVRMWRCRSSTLSLQCDFNKIPNYIFGIFIKCVLYIHLSNSYTTNLRSQAVSLEGQEPSCGLLGVIDDYHTLLDGCLVVILRLQERLAQEVTHICALVPGKQKYFICRVSSSIL